jgi:oxygen-independent coproporphyrinogen-3 oxidase
MLRTHPVTRICINPQTLHDRTLRLIGRGHTVQQFMDMYALARSLGFDQINTDLIAALPGEDLDMFRETLEGILALAPEGITVHSLCIKRSSRLHEMGYRVQSEQAEQMLRLTRRHLLERGYGAYYLYRQKYAAGSLENVGYALPGNVCRYNIDNMEDLTSVLALGAGAISKRLGGEGERILHAPNVSNIDAYIARVDEMVRRKEALFCGFETGEYGC